MVFDFVMENFGKENLFTILFIVNYILAAIAYKLGFAKKLAIIKSVIVYILLAIGVFVLNIMFIVLPVAWAKDSLPLTESLVIICLVLGIYRLRLYRQRKKAS
ncbi:YlaH-like family protein [Ornithinibacillus halophilus]|uniref:YlaH-like protein n=1 Tax=Ornithinibacillus halophilus TaxID=930117 RepID=A0A1M5C106_9BACI|nr:YlaH-like family protein [Ornithinibacillus halophilus]SHF48443.1 YlaH-like protein [Ornithinibacillus halophilus]